MNNPLNTPQNPNELVLRLIGGERDGQLFTVEKEKCLLSSFLPSNVDAEDYRCAIFRGEKGVAFRSYSDHVLCNGAKVSVQWLKKGDLIKVTDSFSVEVYQLGVYTKKPAAASTASRGPVQTIEIPGSPTPAAARTESVTVPTSSDTVATPNVNALEQTSTPADYAKPSVQFSSVSASSGDAPKFKPATDNLRTPAVTAPILTGQVPTEPQVPTASVSRMPATTQALDVSTSTPSAPSNSTIDSLSERLSKLVDSAAGNEESQPADSQSADSESIETPSSARPSVSTMVIEPATTEPTSEGTAATPEAPPRQSATTVVQPTPPSIATPPTRVEAPTIVNSPAAPVVEVAGGESSTGAAEQAGTASNAVERRSALESYFAKSGVSLSDTASPPKDEATLAAPVSPTVEPAAAVTPEVPVESPVAPTNQSRQPEVTEEVKTTPEFDLDSVLAKLESKSSASPSQSSVIEASQHQQSPVNEVPVAEAIVETPVVETPVTETPVVETPVAETTVAGSTFEQPPVETDNSDQSSPEAPNGDQGGELKSFALLQSLGLDTSGLGQIKEELAQPPLQEEVESIVAEQQTAPAAAEPEKVESVADVLARMQNAGSLQDFKAAEDKADSSAAAISQRDVPTPPQAAPPVATSESVGASSGVEGSGIGESDGGVEGDGAVEDYMSQLLNRMRGDSEPTSGEVAEQNQDKAIKEIAAEKQTQQSATAATTQPVAQGTMTQEEFVPKQKAVRMQKLDSLRAIANSNAREAFQKSVAKERKVNTQTKLTLSVFSLVFAFMFFILSCMMKDQINFWGVAFGLVFLIIGLMTARTYLSERKLDKSILSD